MTVTLAKKAPFRSDQVGSLLRPAELKKAREQFDAGEIDKAALTQVEDEEIKKIVEKQIKSGLKAVTDGEFRRSWWHLDFLAELNGVESYSQNESYKFKGAKTRDTNVRFIDRVSYNPDHSFFDAFKFMQSIVPEGILVKQTIPSPTLYFRDHRSDQAVNFYPTREDFLDDLAAAYHKTIRHFYDLGCRYLQLDDTTWAFLINQIIFTRSAEEKEKYEQLAKDSVTVINKALNDLPEDLTITTHICRGNFQSTFLFSGGYGPVAKYLAQLNLDGYFLEYDNERSGDFAPLGEIFTEGSDKKVVLGLVTSKFPELESEDALQKRIEEAANYVPLKNLCLSTQCGFASTEEGNKLTEAQQWAKLGLVVDVAKKVWEE
ncbi:vitamin B12 independent methionine synthase [Sporolactobacillus nakayamae]|uniref:Methionine synthase II (Cobalamin-independent) n=1 Tax=Sporolactobacillus nakayamae TaxID=269670 RepID=A0A1I2SJ71_9BACL|nr:vitamin B12 independent methionine synthase [Sporolactobacillus nakayamae]SFG52780.1 Methionine synthase II (cobalamin-independent) [Sporolactobacillus nakayamae]